MLLEPISIDLITKSETIHPTSLSVTLNVVRSYLEIPNSHQKQRTATSFCIPLVIPTSMNIRLCEQAIEFGALIMCRRR
jgi:hypothetical protein